MFYKLPHYMCRDHQLTVQYIEVILELTQMGVMSEVKSQSVSRTLPKHQKFRKLAGADIFRYRTS